MRDPLELARELLALEWTGAVYDGALFAEAHDAKQELLDVHESAREASEDDGHAEWPPGCETTASWTCVPAYSSRFAPDSDGGDRLEVVTHPQIREVLQALVDELEASRAQVAELTSIVEVARKDRDRLLGWLDRIEGGDHPCDAAATLRQWAWMAGMGQEVPT